MFCVNCGKEISDGSTFCPECGAAQQGTTPPPTSNTGNYANPVNQSAVKKAPYRAAKATMAELLGGEKLPKMDVLKEKRRQLAARKKALYMEYRKAQQDMRELVAVKGSVDHLRGLTDNQRNKEQAR